MFRANVAALIQCQNKYVACYREDHKTWQCVQGGIEPFDLSPVYAITRELQEELGVQVADFKIKYQSKFWRRYYFKNNNKRFAKKNSLGQEQLWFKIELFDFNSIQLLKSTQEFKTVELFTIDKLMTHYSAWKKAPFLDFCREIF